MGFAYQKSPEKMASQTIVLIEVADSAWRATLNKDRQVYTAVVRPAITYGASV